MSSPVDISNMALSRIGDYAGLSSIDPPEDNVQSRFCALWYPVSRDRVQAEHAWSFMKFRLLGSLVTFPYPQWTYAYALPANTVKVLAVIPKDAPNDQVIYGPDPFMGRGTLPQNKFAYTPQSFAQETLADGSRVLLTNQQDALIIITRTVLDSTKFPAMFIDAQAWLLAHYLAGPIIKGAEGAKTARSCWDAYMGMIGQAKAMDANNQHVPVAHIVPWMSNR